MSASTSNPAAQNPNESPPWEAKRSQPKKGVAIRKFITWAAILGLLTFVGYGLKPRPIEVEVAQVSRGPLTVYVSEEGKTRIRNRYIVSAPVAGQMRRVPFKEGDTIKASETVLTTIEPTLAPFLDPRTKAQAEARVEMAEASLKRAAEAAEISKTASEFAAANWQRIKKIADSGSISAIDRDNAERENLVASREVKSAEFALQVAAFDLQQAKAALLQATSPSPSAAILEVKAPVGGQVLDVMQESATIVSPGTAIMEIGDPTDIEVEAEILSRDAVAIEPGAFVSIEQWGGEPLRGRVRRVEPAAFTKVSALGVEEQRVIVLADFVDPPEQIKRLGDRYRIEMRVAVWQKDDVMLIPAGAVFREGNEWKTFVFENGKAKAIQVEAGRTDGRMTELVGGLEVGTEVLLHPPDTVVDGASIVKRD